MINNKVKGLISIAIIGVIYLGLKLYVMQTPSTADDNLPNEFLQNAVAVSST